MTLRNIDVVDRFYDDGEPCSSANMELSERVGGGKAVIGYGHAAYAYRPPDDRYSPVVFVGWSDASRSTQSHIKMLVRDECTEAQGRAKKTDVDGDPSLEVLMQIDDDDTNYSRPHHKRDRGY